MRTRGALLLVGLVTIFSFFTDSAFAQQQKDFTLSPLRRELSIEPGATQQGKLKIENPSDKDVLLHLSAEAFSVINQEYDYAFDATSQLASWVRFSQEDVSLKPAESVDIEYTVAVPPDAEPGGRYISMFASTSANSSSGGVESHQRIGSLLYITVLGDVTREGYLISLSSPFFMGDASRYSMTLQNKGTAHFRSLYSVSLNNIFTGREVSSLNSRALILPGTVRSIIEQLPLPRWPGIYKATYSVGLGDTPSVTETHYIVYMPTNFIIFIASALFLVGGLWLQLRKKRKTR